MITINEMMLRAKECHGLGQIAGDATLTQLNYQNMVSWMTAAEICGRLEMVIYELRSLNGDDDPRRGKVDPGKDGMVAKPEGAGPAA